MAPPRVGGNENRGRRRVEPFPLLAPPPPDRGHGKGAGVMIGPDIDKAGVAPDIVDAIGIGPRHLGRGKIVTAHPPGLLGGKPLLPGIWVVSDEFLLLGVHRDHGVAVPQPSFDGVINVAELRVAIRMVLPLFRFAIALQAVVEVMENLGDLGVADGMLVPSQRRGNRSRALADPPQRRFGIAPRWIIDHLFQGGHQPRVRHRNRFPARARAADPTFQPGTLFDLMNAFGDRLARQSARSMYQTHAPIAQRLRLAGRHETPRALVQ